ncbi:amino acid permease-domain-containing protein [Pyrenochaeta sp. MPI-SDFR-AT-0127]|nr:amino acid permease-domain-containing protein [Pyrenochaeta sp. MPI-SDFR-AT-0127]
MDDEQRPQDRSPYYVHAFEHLHRVLHRPQLAGIGLSGCVGVGLFVSSSTLVATTGSLGAAVSYLIAGGIVACVFYSITEMIACRPITGALINLPHKFLGPAYGFTIGSLYAVGELCCMATLTASSAELTVHLRTDGKPHTIGQEAAINIAFIVLTTLSHCLGVKLYGKIERVVMCFKLCLLALVCILMVALNFGGGGRSEQGSYNANYTSHAFAPGWRPAGYNTTENIPLKLKGVSYDEFGISGGGGALFAFVTSVASAIFSCFGADLVAMTAGEAKRPWRDVPATMSFVYLVPLTLYPFIMLAGGANVNYANSNLPKVWNRGGGVTKSIFVIAAEESSLHALPKVLNAFFIVSAYTTANTYLYAASRNVFVLSQQFCPPKIAKILGRTNLGQTPLAAILFCSAFGFLSLIGLADRTGAQPRITLAEIYTGTAACINLFQCVTFLRFKAGLDLLEKDKIFGRSDPLYKKYLFRSRWQPLPAYIGIVGCAFVIIWSGIPPLVILIAKGSLTSTGNLKSTTSLVFDVLGAYIGPILFAILFFSYKYMHPSSSHVDPRNLTVEDYVLEDLSTIELQGSTSTPPTRRYRPESYELATRPEDVVGPPRLYLSPSKDEQSHSSIEVDPDMQEEIEAQNARENERNRIAQILEQRPKRLERGLWRELWSFIVTDEEE